MSAVRRSFLAAVLLAVVALVLMGCGQAGTTALTHEFKAGDRFTYDMTAVLNGGVTGGAITAAQGKVIPTDTTAKARMEMQVKAVSPDGVATITYRYTSFSVTADGKPVDTGDKSLPEITVKVDKQGKVLSVEGLEGVLPPGLSTSALPFDPSAFGSHSTVVLPKSGVAAPGDEWSETTKVPIPGTDQVVQATAKGKLVSVESKDGRQLATVEYSVDAPVDLSLDIASILKQTGLDAMLGQMGGDLSKLAFTLGITGSDAAKGTATLDTKTGMPVDLRSDVAIKMDVALKDAPAFLPKDALGPTTIDLTATVTLKEVK